MAVTATWRRAWYVSPAGTYWYLTAVPELMELAAARLAQGAPR